MDNEVIIALVGANGGLWVAAKMIGAAWEKWQSYKGKKSDLLTVHNLPCTELHDQLRRDFAQMTAEVNSKLDWLLASVNGLMIKKNMEDGIREKHQRIISNAIGFLREDKGIHDFAIHKCQSFVNFVFAVYGTVFNGDYETFAERIKSLAQSVKADGIKIAGRSYTEFFYAEFHNKTTERYMANIKSVFDDPVNNKIERFIDYSMTFMQEFLSDMVHAHVKFIRVSHDEDVDLNFQESGDDLR